MSTNKNTSELFVAMEKYFHEVGGPLGRLDLCINDGEVRELPACVSLMKKDIARLQAAYADLHRAHSAEWARQMGVKLEEKNDALGLYAPGTK